MQNKKKDPKHYEPLCEKPMAVSKDGTTLSVGGQLFKRVVLPSVVAPKKVEEDLEVAFKEIDEMRTSEVGSDD